MYGGRICVHSFPDPALEVSSWSQCMCVCPAGIGCLLYSWMCDDLWYFIFVWIWRWWWSQPIRQQWATFWMDVLQKLQAVRMSVLQTRMMMSFTPDSHVLTTWNFCWKVCVEHTCVWSCQCLARCYTVPANSAECVLCRLLCFETECYIRGNLKLGDVEWVLRCIVTGRHSCFVDSCLLRWDILSLDEWFLMIWRNVIPAYRV